MPLFVSFSYASMDLEDTRSYFGNTIIDEPGVDRISSQHDLHVIEEQILASFGMPDNYRWVVIQNWKWLPDSGSLNVTGPIVTANADIQSSVASAFTSQVLKA